jgi:hypothetical protein
VVYGIKAVSSWSWPLSPMALRAASLARNAVFMSSVMRFFSVMGSMSSYAGPKCSAAGKSLPRAFLCRN